MLALALLQGCGGGGGGAGGGGGGGGGGASFNASLLLEPGTGSFAGVAGTTVTTQLEVTPATEVAGDVTLSLEAVPSGLSVSLSTAVLTSGESTLSVAVAGGTAAGSYSFTVRAVSATENVTAPISVHVVAAALSSGVTLRLPPKVAMVKGQASSFEMGVERTLGVTGSISLQATVVPSGLTVTFGENPCPDAGSLVTISSSASMAAGSYEVTLKGSTGVSLGTRTLLVEVLESSSTSDFWISRVEFGQTYFAQDLRLVSAKPALIRVHVLADRAGITSPKVRVKGINGTTLVGTMDLSGPATVPTAEEPDSLTASYTGTIPASWVSSGIELRTTLDPVSEVAERDESNNTLLASTPVDSGKVLDIVVVPLTISGLTGRTLDYYETVYEQWPLRDITGVERAAHTVTAVSSLSTYSDWVSVITELAGLRLSDGSSAYYYGLVHPSANGASVAGLGYIGYPVAMGHDNSAPVMSHELGHNFGLSHAPCGGPAGTDANYPHTSASTGDWGFDLSATQLVDPSGYYDVMSYCWPYWVSGYNYKKVQATFDAASLVLKAASSEPEPLLLISGSIKNGVATISSVQRALGRLDLPEAGDHKLRVEFTASAWEFSFSPASIGCGADHDLQLFALCVPDPGDLTALEIKHGETSLLRERVPAGAGLAEDLAWTEGSGVLKVTWDAGAYSQLSIVYVLKGERRTLALGLRGGKAVLETWMLARGGEYEFSFAEGISGKRLRQPRDR